MTCAARAQALLMHKFGGHEARRPSDAAAVRRILTAFHDAPSHTAPFSVHAICRAGAPYGLVPGRWMGPYAICRALSDIGTDATEPHLSILTLDSGGGAPCVDPDMCASAVCLLHITAYIAYMLHLWGVAAVKLIAQCRLAARLAAAPQEAPAASAALFPPGALPPPPRGVLLLLPVVLGVERLNAVYAEQLACVLSWPHCAGIVGGKPGHSYYFLGHQAGRLLGLDPHSIRPTDVTPGDIASHVCADVLSVPTTAIDSTMALAFVCRSAEDARDLCDRMRGLSATHRAAPLVSVGAMPVPPADDAVASWADDSDDGAAEAALMECREDEKPAAAAPEAEHCCGSRSPGQSRARQGGRDDLSRDVPECSGSEGEGTPRSAGAAQAEPRPVGASAARECSGSWHRRVLSMCDSDSSVGGSLVAVTPAGSAPSQVTHAPRNSSALGREGSLGPGTGWEMIEGASPGGRPRESSGPLPSAHASASSPVACAGGEVPGMQAP